MTEKTLRKKAKKVGYSIHKGFQHDMVLCQDLAQIKMRNFS